MEYQQAIEKRGDGALRGRNEDEEVKMIPGYEQMMSALLLLDKDQALCWLDPNIATAELESYFAPQLATPMTALPVSSWVNNARNKDPRCEQGMAEAILLT